ncbi:acyl-CoA dehydrogenase [Microlunatus panaciterrae]|uniref:Alkylation response protein AidB-like acyl-CoA dehydrogenase n=1 Tax=Microlunatus panaciterrae TaxID=400768 RepID=A0ABS2RI91_9ACTN|nr:acyl-CoA dehydrogenase [Microlunatus panaciterrae]MBM7798710.1 alkylation response protein AidB-like acyl-CoA dehydrogenase [Microlunatus panaciterrae]
MSHYKSNLRDITFNLFEVLGVDRVLGRGPYEDLDAETAQALLDEVDHLARTTLAESFAEGDQHPPVFDPRSHAVTMPEGFKRSYRAWMDAGFYNLELPPALGGQQSPPSLQWSIAELALGANPALYIYASGPRFAYVLWANGTERDKKIAQHMVQRGWGATMVLTEPDAGSDVGSGRTKATLQPDGSWHIEGVKRFITSGEHDLTENIVHLVLARPQGIEGVGGPGTKGLSLFIVPKYDFDLETGELTGGRNGVYATGVEKKMGIKASTTCELTFGDGTPAKGWLLGEVHNGIAQMFQVIEYARMMVGTKAIATLSTGYLNALEYAKTRVQGPDLTRASDKTAPRVTITHHADVRRSLLTQKAAVEGMRSLVLYAATMQDRLALARLNGTVDDEAARVNDLLLPIVKGYGSERSWTLLGTESLQTLGGSGFLSDYPLEQYVRDAKIDTLYEGTTAIQGQDLFLRKIVRDRGQALGYLSGQIAQFVASEAGNGQLKDERELLQKGLEDAGSIVGAMINQLQSAAPEAPEGDVRNVYKVGLNTSRLLMALGDVICAWLLLRGAEVALRALNGELSEADKHFYEGKVASARWFARTVLPKITAERVIAERTDLAVMDLPEGAF